MQSNDEGAVEMYLAGSGVSYFQAPDLTVQRLAGKVHEGDTFIATHRYTKLGNRTLLFHTERYAIGQRVFPTQELAQQKAIADYEKWIKKIETTIKRARKALGAKLKALEAQNEKPKENDANTGK